VSTSNSGPESYSVGQIALFIAGVVLVSFLAREAGPQWHQDLWKSVLNASPSVSQGDVALCFYLRDATVVGGTALEGLVADANDGQLIGLAAAAFATTKGTPQRNAAVARCRAIGAL